MSEAIGRVEVPYDEFMFAIQHLIVNKKTHIKNRNIFLREEAGKFVIQAPLAKHAFELKGTWPNERTLRVGQLEMLAKKGILDKTPTVIIQEDGKYVKFNSTSLAPP